jgi:predicted sulfurtransferase
LVDVRNTFEYDVGHFVHPTTQQAATHPNMVTFSTFAGYCDKQANDLKDKKVLMYVLFVLPCSQHQRHLSSHHTIAMTTGTALEG